MNFFQSQAQAKAHTTKLVVMFAMAVLSLIIITNLMVMIIFGYLNLEDQPVTLEFLQNQFDWQTFFAIAALVSAVVIGGSVYKIGTLSGGGKVVARMLGGSLVTRATDDPQQRVLLNVVEEMAIASGTPVPEVYLLKQEDGINAFAAGFTVDDAVIGVTQGALDCFDRNELQGVIAHEFSHIVHGDMRLNMRVIGILHGIMLIGLIGYHILDATRSGSRSRNSGGQIFALGAGLMILGYSGTFFGSMIKAAISRQREYLADASAVQYTRDNQGIAGALKKIGGYGQSSYLQSTQAPTMSHAFFANAVASRFQAIFATHPPLTQRIKRLEPRWQGRFPKVVRGENALLNQENVSSLSGEVATSAKGFMDSIGQLESDNILLARECLASMPTLIRENMYSSEGARAVIYGLLLSPAATLDEQLAYLSEQAPEAVVDKLYLMLHSLLTLDIRFRLPLLEIALPQLRALSRKEYASFTANMRWLILADGKVDIFEWALERIVVQYLKTEFETSDFKMAQFGSLKSVKANLETLVSMLCAQFVTPEQQAEVMARVSARLGVPELEILPGGGITMDAFSSAVDKLSLLKPELKEIVIECCYEVVTQDGEYATEEQETLRAIADTLGCPVPIQSHNGGFSGSLSV